MTRNVHEINARCVIRVTVSGRVSDAHPAGATIGDMASTSTPTLRGRRLAVELRKLRARAGLSQAQAARSVGWDRSTLSRIEKPAVRPSPEDVRALLQLYGVDADRHPAILQLLVDSWQRGWWTAYGDAFAGNYVMLEDQAPQIKAFDAKVIPGLLQTADYARTLIRRVRATEDEDLDRLVAARMNRKSILARTDPPHLHYVIGEAAFRQVVGDPDLMRKQISDVWAYAVERPNVTIQVLPFSVGEPFGLEGAFTLFVFPEDDGLDVGHTENLLGEWYAESADQISRIRVAFKAVSEAAMSPDDSAEWLAALAR